MVGSLIAASSIRVIADLIKERITRWLDKRNQDVPTEFYSAIDDHLSELNQWSARIQFYGMSSAKNTEGSIRLDLETPRKFSGLRSRSSATEEADLLRASDHILILGDPGAGKTTTLKRLSRRLLTEPLESGEMDYQFPIVVRLRELSGTSGLYDAAFERHLDGFDILELKLISEKGTA